MAYPYFQGGSEGLILSEAAIIRAGGSIYVPFRAESFISAPYPPLYYYLTAWFWSDGANPFESGRLISLVSALSAAVLVSILVYLSAAPVQRSKSETVATVVIGLLVGLLFLTLPAVTVWAARVRADLLMTALQLAGLVLVAFSVRAKRGWLAFAAIVPFTLAFYTKQTALAGPIAAALYLLLYNGRRWRLTLAWAISFALALGLPFIALNLATQGELFRRLFKYHNLPWSGRNFETYITLFYQENAALLTLSGALLLLTLALLLKTFTAPRPQTPPIPIPQSSVLSPQSSPFIPHPSSLILFYLLASLALLVGLGVSGADHNHFLPAEAATCAAAGLLVCRLMGLPNGWRWLTLLAVAGLWAQVNFFSVPPGRYEIEVRQRGAEYQQQLGRIVSYAATRPGPILSSEAGFYVLTGKASPTTVYYNDLFTLAALDKQGLYSQAGLLERVRRKEFAVVLAEADLFKGEGRPDVWTPELRAALEDSYYRKFSDIWFIYEPKP